MSESDLQRLQQSASQDLDVVEYLKCLATGKPFEAKYVLFGNIEIVFRELSLQDKQIIQDAEYSRGIDKKQAEIFASISQFNNNLQSKSHTFRPISELSRTTQDVVVQLVKWFRENVVTTVSVYEAIERVYDDFKTRINKLIDRASDPDFFVKTSQQEQ